MPGIIAVLYGVVAYAFFRQQVSTLFPWPRRKRAGPDNSIHLRRDQLEEHSTVQAFGNQ